MKLSPEELKEYINSCIESCEKEIDTLRSIHNTYFTAKCLRIMGAVWSYRHILLALEEGTQDESQC